MLLEFSIISAFESKIFKKIYVIFDNIKHKNFEKELDKNAITEGYYTAKAAIKIASENNIEMPILESVFNILYNGFDIEDEINKLMSRPLTIENIN